VEEVEAGEIIEYDFPKIDNFSHEDVSEFMWGDVLPEEVRLQMITTGTWNEDLNYDIEYITNKNSNWKTLDHNVSTKENKKIKVTDTDLGLGTEEHLQEFRFMFGKVGQSFSEIIMPSILAKVIEVPKNNELLTNKAYIKASYSDKEFASNDEIETIIYTKTATLSKLLVRLEH